MASVLPRAVFALDVPPGGIIVHANEAGIPAHIRITMAAIDPSEDPEPDEEGNVPEKGRSTLRMIKERIGFIGEDSDEDSDDEEDEELRRLLGEDSSDEEDNEPNGGPSDPAKSKKARQQAAIKKLLEAAQEEDSDEEMENGDVAEKQTNGVVKTAKSKGKEPATEEDSDEDDEDEDDDSDSDDGAIYEDYVVCTLDTDRLYQQTLDITIAEGEKVSFMVSGSHAVSLTGNYVEVDEEYSEDDSDEGDYDLPPDLDEVLAEGSSDDELDEVDDMDRIAEVDTDDEEEVPKLVVAKKGKKRPAEDSEEADGLDAMIAKEADGAKVVETETKLSKKQLKKLKNNKGEAVTVQEETKSAIKESSTPTKSDKKVQFAKNLEQGPTGSAEKAKSKDGSSALGVKVVQGVKMDDRKLGKGRAVKKGDRVSVRYIGKLESNGKVFDSNKKGTPFSFKVGSAEVIKGWDIGIVGMSVGGERRVTIPASLGYGAKGTAGIPGNSTLVFDIKLLEIK